MSWWKKIETDADMVVHNLETHISDTAAGLKKLIEKIISELEGKNIVSIEHGGHIDKDGTGNISIGIIIKKPVPAEDAPSKPEAVASVSGQSPTDDPVQEVKS